MTDATHTSGPWHVEPLQTTNGADIAICAPNSGYVVAVVQHDPDIQTCDNPDGETVKFHPSDKANAALIAAAPDLLQAAKNALADLQGILPEFEPSGDRQHTAWQTIKELGAAIAKAKA